MDDGNVTLGNDDTCKVICIGNVHINMHDGIVRTLCIVRHIPGLLKKNLTSLGILDANGCKFNCKGRVIKILKAC